MSKLVFIDRRYIILEKIGDNGDIKILPRILEDHTEAVQYLQKIDDQLEKTMPLHRKKLAHFLVAVDEVSFLGSDLLGPVDPELTESELLELLNPEDQKK